MQRFLAQRLDGQHDRSSLIAMLFREIHEGRLVVHDNGKPVTDDGHRNEIVGRIIEENLNEIARKGLLIEMPTAERANVSGNVSRGVRCHD
jgi:hypothetical protein